MVSQPPNSSNMSKAVSNGHSESTQRLASDARSQEVLDILEEMAGILNVDLSRDALARCVVLLRSGVPPETLAHGVKELLSAAQRN